MEKKGFRQEFKEFIMRGNVMDMAVGIIIGSAFTAIVNSLVADIITPILGMITGGLDFSTLAIKVGDAELMYGNFIGAIINFLLIAFVVFWIVKALNKARAAADKLKAEEEAAEAVEEEPPAPAEDILLLTEIRDLLKK